MQHWVLMQNFRIQRLEKIFIILLCGTSFRNSFHNDHTIQQNLKSKIAMGLTNFLQVTSFSTNGLLVKCVINGTIGKTGITFLKIPAGNSQSFEEHS